MFGSKGQETENHPAETEFTKENHPRVLEMLRFDVSTGLSQSDEAVIKKVSFADLTELVEIPAWKGVQTLPNPWHRRQQLKEETFMFHWASGRVNASGRVTATQQEHSLRPAISYPYWAPKSWTRHDDGSLLHGGLSQLNEYCHEQLTKFYDAGTCSWVVDSYTWELRHHHTDLFEAPWPVGNLSGHDPWGPHNDRWLHLANWRRRPWPKDRRAAGGPHETKAVAQMLTRALTTQQTVKKQTPDFRGKNTKPSSSYFKQLTPHAWIENRASAVLPGFALPSFSHKAESKLPAWSWSAPWQIGRRLIAPWEALFLGRPGAEGVNVTRKFLLQMVEQANQHSKIVAVATRPFSDKSSTV